jgi:hypothetical protein
MKREDKPMNEELLSLQKSMGDNEDINIYLYPKFETSINSHTSPGRSSHCKALTQSGDISGLSPAEISEMLDGNH